MDAQKQVVHFEAKAGFTTAQSNEHQRRWTEKGWECSNANGRIDRTREHLNFEVVKGGKVQPVDKSRSIPEKLADNLRSRGIDDPNSKCQEDPKYRTVVDFIISGSHDTLHNLAFGSQTVDLSEGADNSAITRRPEIEHWAQDMYRVMCDRYGEDNILSFVVHLDERSPHIHADLVPVTDDNKVSFKKVFVGKDKYEYRAKTLALHDAFAKVNERWGLQRGDSIALTGAKHRSSEEYRRDLSSQCTSLERDVREKTDRLSNLEEQIKLAQTRIKGLNTMVSNLEGARRQVESELDEVRSSLLAEDSGSEHAHILHQQEESLRNKLDGILFLLADKRQKLATADSKYKDLQQRLSDAQEQHEELQRQIQSATGDVSKTAMDKAGCEALWSVLKDFNHMKASLPPEMIPAFDDSLLQDMSKQGMQIVACAALLSIGLVDKATTFAQNYGGGGHGSGSGWGKDPDEDERQWIRRCLAESRKMMKPSGKKMKR